MSAAELFRSTFSREPDALFSAPGRVNLIGEHTDYSGGLVLPFAIDARAHLAAAANQDGTIRVTSAQRPREVITVAVEDLSPDSAVAKSWAGYLLGAIWTLRRGGHPIGGSISPWTRRCPPGPGSPRQRRSKASRR